MADSEQGSEETPVRKVKSAARAQPLAEVAPTRRTSKEIQAVAQREAANTLLNGLSLLREAWDDFRASDRFFKYKAAVLATWVVLALTAVGISCRPAVQGNKFDAKLIINSEVKPPLFSVVNHGEDTWKDVIVTVNGNFKITAAAVAPTGEIMINARSLVDGNTGASPPENMVFDSIIMQTADGDITLYEHGQPL